MAVKPLSSDKQRKMELESVLDTIVKTVNYLKCVGKGKSARVFEKVCEEMNADNVTFLLHTVMCQLSRSKVLTRVFKLRREISAFLTEKNHEYATYFLDHNWVSTLTYLASAFDVLFTLNTSLQGKRSDIFFQVGKIDAFKKIHCWFNKDLSSDYLYFRFLNEFLSEDYGVEDTVEIKKLVLKHLKLLRKNFISYFPEEKSKNFCLVKWMVNPFILFIIFFFCNNKKNSWISAIVLTWRKSLKKKWKGIFLDFSLQKGKSNCKRSIESSVSISQYISG